MRSVLNQMTAGAARQSLIQADAREKEFKIKLCLLQRRPKRTHRT